MTNYYKILGVTQQASDKEIKTAFRKLAKQYHPDAVSDNPSLTQKMYKIQEAYEILSDEQKRKKYDDSLRAELKGKKTTATSGGNGETRTSADMSQFERFFGFRPGEGMDSYRDKRAGTKNTDAPIDPEQLFATYFGKKK